MPKTIVIALGGNALQILDRPAALKRMVMPIAGLYKAGNRIAVTHGNGPQVGRLADIQSGESLALLTAETEAEIGGALKRALTLALHEAMESSLDEMVAVLLTRVLVDGKDTEFVDPTKPIGRFYKERDAKALVLKGYMVKKLIRGYRRVVPSPEPLGILEIKQIAGLVASDNIVIACGGGGIPVYHKNRRLEFAEAVIDKDRTAALLAEKLYADMLIILTDVDGAYINFGKKNQKLLGRISAKVLGRYMAAGQFEEGSMKPKVEACISFAEATGRTAVIGNLNKLEDTLRLEGCTVVRA